MSVMKDKTKTFVFRLMMVTPLQKELDCSLELNMLLKLKVSIEKHSNFRARTKETRRPEPRILATCGPF